MPNAGSLAYFIYTKLRLKHTWYFSTEHFPHRGARAYFYPLEAIQIYFTYFENRSE